ncbi:MAG: nicotinic acid mononucleotide adenylyltransferase [Bacteroidetes bacterium RBG_13_46_8]|nr:MAG: nicotinic acid mononucleotide adenylyltransferase [Bacteroidetes bacterium RBG_13_46_8]
MKTGLFFGSFNPVHIGHMAIANYMVEFTDLQQLWFVISPHNPLKPKQSLLADYHRRSLMEIAVEKDPRYRVSDIEFSMPQPSYTIDTLAWLKEKYPDYAFVILMGSDGLPAFRKWKNYRLIEDEYQRYIYPRPGYPVTVSEHKNITVVDAPLMEISSSFIREAIRNGKNIRNFLPPKVYDYIEEMHFYKDNRT